MLPVCGGKLLNISHESSQIIPQQHYYFIVGKRKLRLWEAGLLAKVRSWQVAIYDLNVGN